MKIQFNTDANIQGTETLITRVSASVEQALARFETRITRVEVHLSDESRGKSGQHDQRCMLEARLEGLKPLAVTDHAESLDKAVHGATKKLVHLLDSTLGRLQDQREKNSAIPVSDPLSDSSSELEPE